MKPVFKLALCAWTNGVPYFNYTAGKFGYGLVVLGGHIDHTMYIPIPDNYTFCSVLLVYSTVKSSSVSAVETKMVVLTGPCPSLRQQLSSVSWFKTCLDATIYGVRV